MLGRGLSRSHRWDRVLSTCKIIETSPAGLASILHHVANECMPTLVVYQHLSPLEMASLSNVLWKARYANPSTGLRLPFVGTRPC